MISKKVHFTAAVLLLVMILSTLLTSCRPGDNNENNCTEGEGGASHPPVADPTDDNYRTFYQIFVGSFSDSNGDGIGDLRGIINRMDYLNDGDISAGNDLGIQGIWLSPIFSSPSYHKYDAVDYYEIDDRFGTEEDLRELIRLCDERNVKIILDLVINHTSSQNKWFLDFKNARKNNDTDSKYYDYYSCVSTLERLGGITYSKIGSTDFWYECNFSEAMPELNFDNPLVRQDMLSLAKYYLDLGIDGFRFDAVKYIYFNETEKNVDFWKWYMSELTEYKPDIYCVGECWSAEAEILEYTEAMNCFNFAMSSSEGYAATAARNGYVSRFANYIEAHQDKLQAANPGAFPMHFLSNHDQDRIAGAFITESQTKMAASLYLLAPGSPFIYYGEEIGIRGSRGSAMTDANRRLAMLWGDGDKIRNPEGSTYPEKNQITTTVADQLADEGSMLSHYQKLISIRTRYPAIARGEYNAFSTAENNVGGFYIEYEEEILGVIHNTSDSEKVVDLSSCESLDGHSFSEICEIVGADATLDGETLIIGAYTSIILK